MQIARAFDAEVTGVCSTGNLELVRSIGADHVVDYTREDVTRGGERYDLIVDTAAFRSISDYERILGPEGRYVMIGGSVGRILQVTWLGLLRKRMSFMMAKMTREGLGTLSELLEAGELKPVVDRRYPLSEVPEALRYVGKKHTRGKSSSPSKPAVDLSVARG